MTMRRRVGMALGAAVAASSVGLFGLEATASADPQGPSIGCGVSQQAECSPPHSPPIVGYSAQIQASNSATVLVDEAGSVWKDGAPAPGVDAAALKAPIVGDAVTPTATGYWLVGSDGGVFSLDGAGFYGSTGALHLNQPVVGMASTPDGKGYWLVAADGGVFSFGDAGFYGSTGALHLNKPVVGMASTPDGKGYWLVAADGGIFSFGDAGFHGSAGDVALARPVVAMAAAPGGTGYWLIAADGGVFTYGTAPFEGSFTGTIAALGTHAVGAALEEGPAANPVVGVCTAAADGNVLCEP